MNLDKIRSETRGLSDKLFVNSAGSSLMPVPVLDQINSYLQKEEDFGGYKTAELLADEIQNFYVQTAELINCEPRNIAFAFNATDAYAKVLSSIQFNPGDIILTTDDDYVSNYINFLALSEKFGVQIKRVENLPNGDLDLKNFEESIVEYNPKVVAVTHVPTNSGLVQDINAVGRLCAAHGSIYIVDACQSAGQLQLDVKDIKCDFLSATGRKFLRGPRGTGFLYVSDRMLNENHAPLFVDLRGAEWTRIDHYDLKDTAQRFETWEVPYAFLSGLGTAIEYVNKIGLETIEERNLNLMNRLRTNLSSIPDVQMFDFGSRTSNILTFQKNGKSRSDIEETLDNNKVIYSVTEKGNALIDFEKKNIEYVIRISPHYFNSLQEMDRLSEIIEFI